MQEDELASGGSFWEGSQLQEDAFGGLSFRGVLQVRARDFHGSLNFFHGQRNA